MVRKSESKMISGPKERRRYEKGHSINILLKILDGDFRYIRMVFYSLAGKGYFKGFYRRLTKKEIEMWVDDLCQQVFLALFIKQKKGPLSNIRFAEAYVRKIIINKSIDENEYIDRFISLDQLDEK